MKTYAYIRVSTPSQMIDSQEFEIKEYCKRKEISVDVWVSEQISGTIAVKNRCLGKLIKRMESGDLLLCTEISRLGRNMLMIMGILNICAEKGIRIHTIKDNFELNDSINSKIIAFAFALASEIERNLISQRTKEALAVKKANGERLGRPVGPSKTYLRFKRSENEIRALLKQGIPMCKVAEQYKIHRNSLAKYLKF